MEIQIQNDQLLCPFCASALIYSACLDSEDNSNDIQQINCSITDTNIDIWICNNNICRSTAEYAIQKYIKDKQVEAYNVNLRGSEEPKYFAIHVCDSEVFNDDSNGWFSDDTRSIVEKKRLECYKEHNITQFMQFLGLCWMEDNLEVLKALVERNKLKLCDDDDVLLYRTNFCIKERKELLSKDDKPIFVEFSRFDIIAGHITKEKDQEESKSNDSNTSDISDKIYELEELLEDRFVEKEMIKRIGYNVSDKNLFCLDGSIFPFPEGSHFWKCLRCHSIKQESDK